MLSMVVACGKDNSSGGKTSSSQDPLVIGENGYTAFSHITESQLTYYLRGKQEGQNAVNVFNEVLNWRNSSHENGAIRGTGFTRGKPSGQSCTGKEIDLKIISLCSGGYETYFEETPTQFCTLQDNGAVIYARSVQVDAPFNIYGCNLGNQVTYSKGHNEELNVLFSLNNGQWDVHSAVKEGTLYQIIVGEKGQGPSRVYQINTAEHSVYAPQGMGKVKVQGYWTVLDGKLSVNLNY